MHIIYGNRQFPHIYDQVLSTWVHMPSLHYFQPCICIACLWLDAILWSNCRLVNESTDLTVSLSNRVPLIRHITPDLMYVCSWAGCLCSPLWHHITATEGLQCFSLHCYRSSRWGEVRDCVIRWSMLLSETPTPVMNLTSSHCLSLEVCDAQVIKDGRSNTKLLSVCINNSWVTL